jgi:hypothetical protein
MGVGPRRHGRSEPNTTDSKICFWLREVVVGLNELIDTLPRDTEQLGDLGHADQVEDHAKNLT